VVGDGRRASSRLSRCEASFRTPPSRLLRAQGVKDHGTKKRVDGADIAGKTVIILEDVTTTGGSAMDAVKAVQEAGAKVALVISILDRGEGAADL
jgi:orotate phosphoribosyltransferase